jgi:hypothetical protein
MCTLPVVTPELMKPLQFIPAGLGLIALSFTACRENPARKPLTIDETTALLFKIDVRDAAFPNETLGERVAKIQKIAAPSGLTVSISNTVRADAEVGWLKMPQGDLPTLLKFTCGNRRINWRPIPGGVEFYYNTYRDDSAVEGEAADKGGDPFAHPGEQPPNADTESMDDADDPFRPLEKAN